MATLRVPMTINGVSYAAGDTPTPEHADLIRNPDAWTGGTAPPLSRRGGVFSVASFPLAVPDNATDSTAAVKAAVEMARAYGGTVEFPGKYVVSDTITMYDGMGWRGLGPGISGLRMANGVNKDLVKTDLFDTLNPGSTTGGPMNWSITGMTLDGNRAGNPTVGYVLSIYGANFRLNDLHIFGGRSGGIRSRWGTGGTNMEAHVSQVKVFNNGGQQIDWQGPHDSQFNNLFVFTDSAFHGGAAVAGSRGLLTGGNAAGEQFNNLHVWGFHEVGVRFDKPAMVSNGVSEGAQVNVWIANNRCGWRGDIFGTAGSGPYAGTEVGLRIGVAPSSSFGEYYISGTNWNWAAGDRPVEFAADGGGSIQQAVRAGGATAAFFGTPSARSSIDIVSTDRPDFIQSEALLTQRALGYMDGAIETAPRSVDLTYVAVSGRVNLSYVTSYRTQPITKLGACTRGTAVAGLTSVRWGLYEVAANGDLTLVARTAQQGSASGVYSATFTEYNAALDTAGGFPSSYTLIKGKSYALAQICVFTTTAPQLRAAAANLPTSTSARTPRLNGVVAGQSDLPATITAGTVGADGNTVYLLGLA